MTQTMTTTAGAHTGGRQRIPAVDGLRGAAVLAVMLFHTNAAILPAGYLGVDVFFVISGFLIADILYRGRPRVTGFWLRRARRLAPALLVLLAFVALMRLVHPTPGNFTPGPLLAALTYTTNWFEILRSGSYFAAVGPPSVLLHTWSLAIEEQFYLIFPLVLLAVTWKRRPTRRVAMALAVLAAASALWTAYLWLSGASIDRVYMGTDCRVQSLLVGAVLGVSVGAVRRSGPESRSVRLASLGGAVVLILAVILVRDVSAMFVGGFLLVAVATAAVVLAAIHEGPLARALSWRPVTAVGVISYSVYLWHYPIFAWIQGGDDVSVAAEVWSWVVTFAVAAASYRFVERPFLRGRVLNTGAARQWLTYLVAAAVIAATALLPAGSWGKRTSLTWPTADQVPPSIMVMGDSVALGLDMYFPRDRYPATQVGGSYQFGCSYSRLSLRTAAGVMPVDVCQQWRQKAEAYIAEHDPRAVVVESPGWVLFPRVVDGVDYPVGTPVFDDDFRSTLSEVISVAGGDGRQVYVVKLGCMLIPGTQENFTIADIEAANRLIDEVVAQAGPDVRTVDPRDVTCAGGRSTNSVDGVVLRDDGMHWTPRGGEVIWNKILHVIAP